MGYSGRKDRVFKIDGKGSISLLDGESDIARRIDTDSVVLWCYPATDALSFV